MPGGTALFRFQLDYKLETVTLDGQVQLAEILLLAGEQGERAEEYQAGTGQP